MSNTRELEAPPDLDVTKVLGASWGKATAGNAVLYTASSVEMSGQILAELRSYRRVLESSGMGQWISNQDSIGLGYGLAFNGQYGLAKILISSGTRQALVLSSPNVYCVAVDAASGGIRPDIGVSAIGLTFPQSPGGTSSSVTMIPQHMAMDPSKRFVVVSSVFSEVRPLEPARFGFVVSLLDLASTNGQCSRLRGSASQVIYATDSFPFHSPRVVTFSPWQENSTWITLSSPTQNWAYVLRLATGAAGEPPHLQDLGTATPSSDTGGSDPFGGPPETWPYFLTLRTGTNSSLVGAFPGGDLKIITQVTPPGDPSIWVSDTTNDVNANAVAALVWAGSPDTAASAPQLKVFRANWRLDNLQAILSLDAGTVKSDQLVLERSGFGIGTD